MRSACKRASVRDQRHGGTAGCVGVLDAMAAGCDTSDCFDVECTGRADHLEHGDRADNERLRGFVCECIHATDLRRLRLFCTVRLCWRMLVLAITSVAM